MPEDTGTIGTDPTPTRQAPTGGSTATGFVDTPPGRGHNLKGTVGYQQESRDNIIKRVRHEAATYKNVIDVNDACERCVENRFPCYFPFPLDQDLGFVYADSGPAQIEELRRTRKCLLCSRDKVACSLRVATGIEAALTERAEARFLAALGTIATAGAGAGGVETAHAIRISRALLDATTEEAARAGAVRVHVDGQRHGWRVPPYAAPAPVDEDGDISGSAADYDDEDDEDDDDDDDDNDDISDSDLDNMTDDQLMALYAQTIGRTASMTRALRLTHVSDAG